MTEQTIEEATDKTVATLSRPNGDKFALQDNGTWWSIIKTHQGGKSIQNQWGGYNAVTTGQEKYVKKKWAQMKKVKMKKSDIVPGGWVHYEENEQGEEIVIKEQKSFKQFRQQLDEAKKALTMYDLKKFPEDGLDDLMDHLGRISRARQGRDWDLVDDKGKLKLELYTSKGQKAAEKFFGKNAKELMK